MKNILYLFIVFILLAPSCKKKETINHPTTDSSFIKSTGMLSATEDEIKRIQTVESLDTSVVPYTGRITSLPASTLIDVPRPGNQAGYNSCVGWAVGYGLLSYHFKNIEGNDDYNGSDKLFSPNYIWNQKNGGSNVGITIIAGLDLVQSEGCSKIIDMPIDVKIDALPSSTAKANAAKYKLTEYFRFNTTDIEQVKFWLSKGYPVVGGFKVDNTFMKNDSSPFEKQQDGRLVWKKYTTTERSNHVMLICGYDNAINAFKVLNSWGSAWGDGGYIWIDYDFFKSAISTALSNSLGIYPEIYVGLIKRPILKTAVPSSISQNTSISGGDITSDWGFSVSSKGVCWSSTPNPTIGNNKTSDGVGIGSFSSSITGLTPNTVYYTKAYAINSNGISYGKQISFTTLSPNIPTLTTSTVTLITSTTATIGGTITNDGGAPITARGVCWSTTQNPTIANSKTNDGNSVGTYSSNLTGLTSNVTYYARAYATNSIGTAYGNQVSFKPQPIAIAPSVTIGTQIWATQNLDVAFYQNGDPIPQVSDPTQWGNLTTGAWCYYNNDPANGVIYGKLYNWYAINDSRGIAPAGWHVAGDAEWALLSTFLGGDSFSGGKLKATNLWSSPNTGANNSSGFTALPGGIRSGDGTSFANLNLRGFWWCSATIPTTTWVFGLNYDNANIQKGFNSKTTGYSARCIKD